MKQLAQLLRRCIPKKIWLQAFLVLVCVIIIPLIVLGALLVNTSQKAIKTSVFRDHKEVAVHATDKVEEHIKGARQSILVTASILGTLHADSWRQETAIVELSLRNPAFQRIASVDLNGEEIASSELGSAPQNRGNEEAFQQAIAGASYISHIKISEDQIPYLTLAEPIKEFGQVKGVLMSELNVRSVWDIIDNIHFGETGRAFLIDHHGRIIAHPDKKRVLQNEHIPYPSILESILLGQAGNMEKIREDGERLLISYAPVVNPDWGLVITQPEREAYAFLTVMKLQSWGTILLSACVAMILSLLLARYMSRNIENIVSGTQRVAKGDFSHHFPIKQRNEIGKLLFSFNRMTSKLRKARDVEKLSVIGKAAAAVAHELKNSLVLITTFVELLPERHRDKKFIKEFSETIPKELDSWNTSLRNMMVFSRSYSSFPTYDTNVNDIIKEISLLAKMKARQLDIHFNESLEQNISLINGNKDKLKQVLLNLVTNALEATPGGGQIDVVTRNIVSDKSKNGSADRYVEVSVSNTVSDGCPDDLDKIFNPFHTTKAGGLGLGLSISKEIMDRHNGSIDVSFNEENQSLCFVVKLPVTSEMASRVIPQIPSVKSHL